MQPVPIIFCLSIASLAIGQENRPARLSGLIREPGGQALAAAEVRFYPEWTSDLAWLDPLLSPDEPTSAVSDSGGRFSILSRVQRGSLWIEHPNGLGAVHHGLGPGVPRILKTEPMGEISLASKAVFAVEIRAILPTGKTVYLGLREGKEVRIPAGPYLLLLHARQQSEELPVEVHSGERLELSLTKEVPGKLLDWDPARGEVFLLGWPRGLATRDGSTRLPRAQGLGRVRYELFSITDSRRVRILGEKWYGQGEDLRIQPPLSSTVLVTLVDADGLPLTGAMVYAIASNQTRVQVHSIGQSGPDGTAYPALRRDRSTTHLIAFLAGHAPAIHKLDSEATEFTLRMRPAHGLRLRILDPLGRPLAGTRVFVSQEPTEILRKTAFSNGRGEVEIRDLRDEPSILRIDHHEYLPLRTALSEDQLFMGSASRQPYRSIQLSTGLDLVGRVVDDSGQEMAGVRVEIREQNSGDWPFSRSQTVDKAGQFHFKGLSKDVRYTIFAQSQVKGITWSGRLSNQRAHEGTVRVTLRQEDPPLPVRR